MTTEYSSELDENGYKTFGVRIRIGSDGTVMVRDTEECPDVSDMDGDWSGSTPYRDALIEVHMKAPSEEVPVSAKVEVPDALAVTASVA